MAERTLAENVAQIKADFKGIKDELLNKGASIPSNTPTSEYANIIKNMSTGNADEAYEQGKKETDLAHWNAFTVKGTRANYIYGFACADYEGHTIPQGLCKPKTDIAFMFYRYAGTELPKGIDCSEFDLTASTTSQVYHTFFRSRNLKKIYDIGIPTGLAYNNAYSYCSELEEIEVIRCNENTTFNTNVFNNCLKLKKVRFTGTLANDINLQWTPVLDDESLISLAKTLCMYAPLDKGFMTKTITLHPYVWVRAQKINVYDSDEVFVSVVEYIDSCGWNRA